MCVLGSIDNNAVKMFIRNAVLCFNDVNVVYCSEFNRLVKAIAPKLCSQCEM